MAVTPEQSAGFWRDLARVLAGGVPLVDALTALAEDLGAGQLAEATSGVRDKVLAGLSLPDAMRAFPEVFPAEVCMAVAGERGLDESARLVADAIATGDLSALLPSGLDDLQDVAEGQPARAFVNVLIGTAIRQHGSDIHVEPTGDDRARVRLRVDGVLHDFEPPAELPVQRPPDVRCSEIAARIKAMARLDVAETRLPQDGRTMLNVDGKPYDLRVSSVPALHGERLCVRILDRGHPTLDLDALGLPEDDLAAVRSLCALPRGLVIASGPTGSGKSTVLYAMLGTVDSDHCCVLSVEDPVEYELPGVTQVPVRPEIGRTFPRVIRALLRQDPDVVLVGEIRDFETALLCIQVAMTGHLLMTVLHAETAPRTLMRLVDMGLDPFLLNTTVAGVVSLRLVRVLCPECKQEQTIPEHSLPAEAIRIVGGMEGATFFGPRGCEKCHGTGYRGRTGIYEVLIPDDGVKEALAAGASPTELEEAARAAGMRTMLECGLAKAALGVTSVREVLRAAPHARSR